MENFNPVIVAFCCHYCAYTAADMAGSMRLSYPTGIKVLRVPCSGKVDPVHVMTALKNGADGVLVAGCLQGDCHFKTGNVKASKRVSYLKALIEEIGLEEERVEMVTMSAGMGKEFTQIVTAYSQKIAELGPSPIKKSNIQESDLDKASVAECSKI